MKLFFTATYLLFFISTTFAQGKWNIETPPGLSKKITFTTDEGTWMDLDVSPDGKNIIFDLLGDIYIMPITGGKATLLAGGKAWDVQPRYSP